MLKKIFLVAIPAGLLGVGGLYWVLMDQNRTQMTRQQPSERSAAELFANSEHALRQIVRHGSTETSSADLVTPLENIEHKLSSSQNPAQLRLKEHLEHYRHDAIALKRYFSPFLGDLNRYDAYETANKKRFETRIRQIGFYPLETALDTLDQRRREYLKSPSDPSEASVYEQLRSLRESITSLYLGADTEKPLLEYLDNTENSFRTLCKAYQATGYDRITRLRETGYAIKTELQLLPAL